MSAIFGCISFAYPQGGPPWDRPRQAGLSARLAQRKLRLAFGVGQWRTAKMMLRMMGSADGGPGPARAARWYRQPPGRRRQVVKVVRSWTTGRGRRASLLFAMAVT